MKQRVMIQIFLKLVVSLGFVIWVMSRLDTQSLFDLVARANSVWLILGLTIQLAIVPLLTMRWRLLAARIGIQINSLEALITVFVGQFFNQVLPTSMGGDAVRIWRLTRLNVGLSKAAASVFIDRLFGLTGLLLIPLFGYGLLRSIVTDPTARVASLAVILVGLGVTASLISFNYMPLPKRLAGWLPIAKLRELTATMAYAALHLKTGFSALTITLLIQCLASASMWTIARGLGESHAFLDYLILVPFVMLMTMVPITIAGWGVREAAMVVAMGFLGGDPEMAVATSLLFGVATFAVSLVGGAMWFLSPRSERVPYVMALRRSKWNRD